VTYYGGKDLAAAFRTVRGNTLTIAQEIPDTQYDFKPSPDSRSIGKTLAHIALIPSMQFHIQSNRIDDLTKVNFPALVQGMMAEEAKPRNKAETIAFLKSEGDKFAAYLEGLTEAFLAESVKVPQGGTRSRFEMLLGVKEHEMHHRAQLMLMQRMIGLVPHLTRQMQERMAQAAQAAHR
jgi:uncharacterized damage-inducible protein DinB